MNLKFSKFTKRAITGGVIAMFVFGLGNFLLGELSGYEAKDLITKSVSGINTLCNTIVLASATILALLLTVLSLSSGTDSKLKEDYYQYIMKIAKVDTAVFITALGTFLLFNLPITESENVPSSWYTWLYYTSLAMTSLVAAALIVVILMLYSSVVSIIRIVGLGETDHPLMVTEEDEELKNEKQPSNSKAGRQEQS